EQGTPRLPREVFELAERPREHVEIDGPRDARSLSALGVLPERPRAPRWRDRRAHRRVVREPQRLARQIGAVDRGPPEVGTGVDDRLDAELLAHAIDPDLDRARDLLGCLAAG